MGGYFKPRRRKVGVATLVMACVLVAGWTRSLVIVDTFPLESGGYRCYLQSSDGTIVLASFTARVKSMHSRTFELFGIEEDGKVRGFDSDPRVVWRFRFVGIGKGGFQPYRYSSGTTKSDFDFGMMRIWSTPYWSIAIPLTLLSTCGCCSKPRQRQTPIQPVTDEAA